MARVLIVEDSDFSREFLKRQLVRLGYEVLTAKDGMEAWRRIRQESINFIITDWMMPGMDGLALCRRVRQAKLTRYVYIILLTVKSEKEEMIAGIEAGADEFIAKPCDLGELKVKMNTGERVLGYEQTLVDRNRKLAETLEKLSHAYGVIEKSLYSAKTYLESLLPPRSYHLGPLRFESDYIPCEYVAGDMYNYFAIGKEFVAFYLLDVAGHGVPAAMLSSTLSQVLTPTTNKLAKETSELLDFTQPEDLAHDLNNMFQARSDDSRSFTMIYGLIHLPSGNVKFIQAGHPPLIHLPVDGPARVLGDGGFPMGYFPNARYDIYEFTIQPGDRVYLYTDGLTECKDEQGKAFSVANLVNHINQCRAIELRESLDLILHEATRWRGRGRVEDDLSLVGVQLQ